MNKWRVARDSWKCPQNAVQADNNLGTNRLGPSRKRIKPVTHVQVYLTDRYTSTGPLVWFRSLELAGEKKLTILSSASSDVPVRYTGIAGFYTARRQALRVPFVSYYMSCFLKSISTSWAVLKKTNMRCIHSWVTDRGRKDQRSTSNIVQLS